MSGTQVFYSSPFTAAFILRQKNLYAAQFNSFEMHCSYSSRQRKLPEKSEDAEWHAECASTKNKIPRRQAPNIYLRSATCNPFCFWRTICYFIFLPSPFPLVSVMAEVTHLHGRGDLMLFCDTKNSRQLKSCWDPT